MEEQNLSGNPKESEEESEMCEEDLFTFRSIGKCRSVFANKRGVPRQGKLAPDTKGVVELYSHVSHVALKGLDEFSHVWLIFVFSRNTNKAKVESWLHQNDPRGRMITFPGKVKPPLLLGGWTGIFSSRSPHRPNPIGLTLAKVESVTPDKRQLVISGIDLCDETPILDIKPYVPGDIPFGYDLNALDNPVKFASWVQTEDNIEWRVEFAQGALADISQLVIDKVTSFYTSQTELTDALIQVLRLDIRAVHQGRGQEADGGREPVSHQCVLDNVQFFFDVREALQLITVNKAIKYDASVLE